MTACRHVSEAALASSSTILSVLAAGSSGRGFTNPRSTGQSFAPAEQRRAISWHGFRLSFDLPIKRFDNSGSKHRVDLEAGPYRRTASLIFFQIQSGTSECPLPPA